MNIKHLLEMAGVAHLPKAKSIIALDEGFKEAQVEFAQASDPETATSTIAQFRDLVNRNQVQGDDRNIDFWRKQGWEAFSKFVSDKAQQKSKTQEKRSKTSGQSITLFENDRWLVVAPLDKEASCFHGKGSDWCTTKPTQAYFEDYYYDKGVTLIYCLEKDTGGMWAIAATPKVDRLELFDKKDKPISEEVFLEQTGLNPRDLVAIAHKPDNLARIEESKIVYQQSLDEAVRMLNAGVTERNGELERHLTLIKNPVLSIKYIWQLFNANGKQPVKVPEVLVINAATNDVTVMRWVTGLTNASLRAIVRNDDEAIGYITNPPEQIQIEAIEKDPINYMRIDHPTKKASWLFIAIELNTYNNYLGDLPDELQQMLIHAEPEFQKMMIDRGSLAIRFVKNPTEETKRIVMSDARFAGIRSNVESKWEGTRPVIDQYNEDKRQIEQDMRTSDQIWSQVTPDTMNPLMLKQMTELASSMTDRSDKYIRLFRKEGTTHQYHDIYRQLINFGKTWDDKLAEWEASLAK